MTDPDLRYFWAAYQMGEWDDIMSPDMNRQEFIDTLYSIIGLFDIEFILEARSDDGMRPMGIVLANYAIEDHAMEPHVTWFPWANTRARLGCTIQFLREIGKTRKILLYIDAKNMRYFERLHEYKVIARGCKIPDANGPGNPVMLFYTPGPF